MDKLVVLAHGPNHWMIAYNWQQFFLGCLAFQERSDGLEAVLAVPLGDLACLLAGRGQVMTAEAQEAEQHLQSLNSANLDRYLSPPSALRSQSSGHPAQQPSGAFFDSADLLRVNEFRRGAEAARFLPGLQSDLLHSVIENPHHAAVPPDLNLSL